MEDIKSDWQKIIDLVEQNFQKKPDMNAILFLIGIRELGMIEDKNFKKEEKVDLMHIAMCKVLSYSGHYEHVGNDEQGWPHWNLLKKIPALDIFEQELYIRTHIIEYFKKEELI